MAQLDPLAAVVRTSDKYQLKLHEIAPEDIEPNGDRYIVEEIEIDNKVLLGKLLVVTQQVGQNDRSPSSDPTIENRGVIAAVIIKGGNGHLLGLSDLPPMAAYHTTGMAEIPIMERPWASVPMFFLPGDVVLIDHTARGRALQIVGRTCRLCNQIDILAKLTSVRLHRVNGAWVQEE